MYDINLLRRYDALRLQYCFAELQDPILNIHSDYHVRKANKLVLFECKIINYSMLQGKQSSLQFCKTILRFCINATLENVIKNFYQFKNS